MKLFSFIVNDRSLCDDDNINCDMYTDEIVVVAHTVQMYGVRQKCKGHIWNIDVGLSNTFNFASKQIEIIDILFNLSDNSTHQIRVISPTNEHDSKVNLRAYSNGQHVSTYVYDSLKI